MRMPTNQDFGWFVRTYGLLLLVAFLLAWGGTKFIHKIASPKRVNPAHLYLDGIQNGSTVWIDDKAYKVTEFDVWEYTWLKDRVYIRLEEE